MVLPHRTFSVVERQTFMAEVQATIGVELWRREIAPLFCEQLSNNPDQLANIGDRYIVKLITGHVIVFRIDSEHDLIIPISISAAG